jgi:hypothetical protein
MSKQPSKKSIVPIRMRGEDWSFSFPIMACIITSIVLMVVMAIFFWFCQGYKSAFAST